MASAAAALSNNHFHVPVVVTPQGPPTVSHSQPSLQVDLSARLHSLLPHTTSHFNQRDRCLLSQLLVTDVMSQPLSSANVLAESVVAVGSKSVVLSHVPFALNEYVAFVVCLLYQFLILVEVNIAITCVVVEPRVQSDGIQGIPTACKSSPLEVYII